MIRREPRRDSFHERRAPVPDPRDPPALIPHPQRPLAHMITCMTSLQPSQNPIWREGKAASLNDETGSVIAPANRILSYHSPIYYPAPSDTDNVASVPRAALNSAYSLPDESWFAAGYSRAPVLRN